MIKKRKFDDEKYLGAKFTRLMAKSHDKMHYVSRSTPEYIIVTWMGNTGTKIVKAYDRDYAIDMFSKGYWKIIKDGNY